MKIENTYLAIYIISIIYCFWRFYKRSIKTSLDGVIGNTPGLESLVVIIFAPFLAAIDIIVTCVNRIRLRLKAKKIYM